MTKLQILLLARSMSQTDLCELSKKICVTPLPKYMVSKIYNGKLKSFSLQTMMKICKCLKITPSELVDMEDFQNLFKK